MGELSNMNNHSSFVNHSEMQLMDPTYENENFNYSSTGPDNDIVSFENFSSSSFTFEEVPKKIKFKNISQLLKFNANVSNPIIDNYDTANISELVKDPLSNVFDDLAFNEEVPSDSQNILVEGISKEVEEFFEVDEVLEENEEISKAMRSVTTEKSHQYSDYKMDTYFPKDFANIELIHEEADEEAEEKFEKKIEDLNKKEAENDGKDYEEYEEDAMDFL